MTWETFYLVLGAPLMMLFAGLSLVGITRLLERRERRLYDSEGRPRLGSSSPSVGR